MRRRHRTAAVDRFRTPGRWLVMVAVLGGAAPGLNAAPSVDDSIAQRVLACTGCHGREGRAAADGYYPRIAGKPAGYLYNQLLNFRDGRRHYPLMATLLDTLTDDYLREIAQHFASLDLPYPLPKAPAADEPTLAQGRRLVEQGDPARGLPACQQCHGAALMGQLPATPGLLGLPRDYINGQIGAWQRGSRQARAPDCMADVARKLRPDDVHALSQWLSAQPVPTGGHPAAAPSAASAVSPSRVAPSCGQLPVARSQDGGAR